MSALKTHPYADLFPMMTAAELEALAEDIAANGLRQPLVRYQGKLLDGRNRLAACEQAKVEPTFTDYDGDDAGALALVISLNVQRRDLTAAQRALAAARCINYTPLTRVGRKTLATQFKVSEIYIQHAAALLADASDLVAQVDSCILSLVAAYDQFQQRRAQAKQKAKEAERIAEYKDAISNGETTLEKALQEIMERERQERERVVAEADARRTWLQGFADALDWYERFLHDDWTKEEWQWYVQPDAPGFFDHGITAERVEHVILKLQGARTLFVKGHHDYSNQRQKGRPATRS